MQRRCNGDATAQPPDQSGLRWLDREGTEEEHDNDDDGRWRREGWRRRRKRRGEAESGRERHKWYNRDKQVIDAPQALHCRGSAQTMAICFCLDEETRPSLSLFLSLTVPPLLLALRPSAALFPSDPELLRFSRFSRERSPGPWNDRSLGHQRPAKSHRQIITT